MKEYELLIKGHWYVRCDAVYRQTFNSKDLLDSGLEPEQYAARLFEHAKYPEVSWHDFSEDVQHEQEQIMGDLEIDPVWTLRSYLEQDSSSSGND